MTEALIKKFFDKKCTPPEADEVTAFLKANPDVLELYLGQNDWDETEPSEMPEEFWNENWKHISAGVNPARSTGWIKKAAAAAAIAAISAVTINYLFFPSHTASEKISAISSPPFDHKLVVNNTNLPMHVFLPDSTEVIMSPAALIDYYKPFAEHSRDVSLVGEARFKVKKNRDKPFTVYAGSLATTAVGTEFTINTNDAEKDHVTVKLHTGRVMIRATGPLASKWSKQVFLEAGQELKFDNAQVTAAVAPIRNETAPIPRIKKHTGNISVSGPALTFENTALPEVMAKLSDYYHQQISFDQPSLQQMNFTGSISKSDSLAIVLKVITQMNNLELTHENGIYQLKKEEEEKE